MTDDRYNDPLTVAADQWLAEKRTQLWAHFSIGRLDERWSAACWLADCIRGVADHGGDVGVDPG